MKRYAIVNYRVRRTMRATGGFSLIELLIGSVVFVVVFLAILMILDISQRDYASGAAKSDVQENVRVALESMARELRMAGYAPVDSPHADCPTVPLSEHCGVTPPLTASSVTFQADLDDNKLTDKVTYTFDAADEPTKPCDPSDSTTVGTLTRSFQSWVAGDWSPVTPVAYEVAQCVKTVTITYRDSTGAATAVAANVRRITISIQGEENARGQAPRTYSLATDVWLRNF